MKRKYYVGVDRHKTVIQVSIVDAKGRPTRGGSFCLRGNTVESAKPLFHRLRSLRSVEVAVEAIGVNRRFVDECRRLRVPMIVADPTRLRLKESGTKTDRRDAAELARRLFLGDLTRHAKTYYPSDREYGDRKVLRSRHFLVQLRQSVVNQIRSLLNAYRAQAPRGVLYTGPSLRRLRSAALANPDLQTGAGHLRRRAGARAAESDYSRGFGEGAQRRRDVAVSAGSQDPVGRSCCVRKCPGDWRPCGERDAWGRRVALAEQSD